MKNLKNLGTVLNKLEQKNINGGNDGYQDCINHGGEWTCKASPVPFEPADCRCKCPTSIGVQ